MSTLQNTNLNVSPYFDDYDETKNYYRILYRPRPIQARELNQTQDILQNQINQLGKHIFTEGSVVIPGGVSYSLSQDSIGVTWIGSATLATLTTLNAAGETIYLQSVNTGLIAKVRSYIPATGTDPDYLFIDYVTGGTNTTTPLFVANETLNAFYYNSDGVTTTTPCQLTSEIISIGQWVQILAGVYFVHGYFVSTTTQEIVVSKNSVTSTTSVGFTVSETIVTSDIDSSLYSNAYGFANYKAAGADRLMISLTLDSISPTSVISSNFVKIISFTNGAIASLIDTTTYSDIEVAIAQRSYETNGNYTVNEFGILIKEDLQSTTTPTGVYTAAQGGDATKFVTQLKPGIAYVEGYRIANVGIENIIEDKARTTTSQINAVTSSTYGNYLLVDAMLSLPILNIRNVFNLKNSGGTVVGTTRIASCLVYSLSATQANSIYKLYIFDTKFNTGYSLANVVSIAYADASNLFSATLVGTQIYNSTLSAYIFPLAYNYVSTLTAAGGNTTTYSVMREYDVTTDSSGNASISANANEVFDTISQATYMIGYTGSANTGVIIPVAGTLTLAGSPTGRGLSIALGSTYASKAIKVLAPIVKEIPAPKTKTLTTYTDTITFSSASTMNLTHADIYGLVSVVNASSVNVTNSFGYTDGQNDAFYSMGTIYPVSGGNITGVYTVTYQYWAHSIGDYFCVDSYLGATRSTIPSYTVNGTTYSLADVIDFRPLKDTSGNITSITYNGDMLEPSTSIRADITYYLPRVDSIYVDSNGNFGAIKGIPSSIPTAPSIPSNAMKLYELSIPAYTADVSKISINTISNPTYTMQDIAKLETRIANAEYYTSLSMLELTLANIDVIDPATGTNRFKNGYAVDSFSNFSLADTNSVGYGAGINFSKGILTAQTVIDATEFQQVSLNNGQITTELYTLPYTNSIVVSQPYATTTSNINPYAVYFWAGNITLTPSSDYWVDVVYLDPIITTSYSTSTATTYEILNDIFNARNNTYVTGAYFQWFTNRYPGDATYSTTSTSTTSSSTTTDTVVSTAVIPYMRSINITVIGQNFRPYTTLYMFFEGVNVSAYCTPHGGSMGGALVTDSTGYLNCIFTVPDNSTLSFQTGVGTLRLIDNSANDTESAFTYADSTFTSAGILSTHQVTITNTRVTTTVTTHISVDPLAESFTIGAVGGAFITGIDIFFATKALTLPVRLEIREMSNGYPTTTLVPLASATLYPSQITTSQYGTIASRFVFPDPVYLTQETEYAMVLMANTQEYNVFISELGQNVLNQQYSVAKQPYTGVLFTSSNNSTWTANQLQDLKFNIYQALFTTSATTSLVLENTAPTAVPLDFNALTSTNGSPSVSVYSQSHGLLAGDSVTIAGAVAGNGFTITQLNQTFTVSSVTDIDDFIITLSGNANTSSTFGGAVMTIVDNIPFAEFFSNFNTQTFDATSMKFEYNYKQTSGRAMSGYITYDPTNKIDITAPGIITAAGDFLVRVTMTSNNVNVSPVLDTAGWALAANDFRINNNSADAVYQYITDNIQFDTASTTAKFWVSVLLPASSTMNFYYKPMYTTSDNLDALSWTQLSPTTPIVNNSSSYVEYEYDLSGIGSFIGYQVMVQFLGTDSTNTPIMEDFRTVALA